MLNFLDTFNTCMLYRPDAQQITNYPLEYLVFNYLFVTKTPNI